MSTRSRRLSSQAAAVSFGSSKAPSLEDASLTAEEVADSYINWPEDTPMGDGTVNPRDLLLSSAPSVSMPSASDRPGYSKTNPFGALPTARSPSVDAQGSQQVPGNDPGRSQRRSTTDRSSRETTSTRSSSHRERARSSRDATPVPSRRSRRSEDLPERLTRAEIADLRILLQNFDRHTQREDSHRKSIDNLSNWCSELQDELREAQDTIQSFGLASHRLIRDAGRSGSSHDSYRHHPYRERPPRRPVHTARAPVVAEDVVMEPVGAATHGTQPTVSTTPTAPATVPLARALAGSIPARATRPEKRAPIPMAEYRWVDRATGIRHALAISQAGLPMFPGSIATAFQKLQGSSQSPADLTRRIWLLYRGRSHLDVWKDAVAAARETRRKVVLPQPLQLLLELADLPRNEWEKITKLWATSSEPLSSISPGIRRNPNGFAGLDNYDIETADFIGMWTSGSLKRISAASGQQKDRSDVKSAFHIALTSPNIWQIAPEQLQPWLLTPNLRRLRYDGTLEPESIALWLRKEVGLTSCDVQTRFGPFSRRAFDTDAKTQPRAYFTEHVMPETYPSPSDDSLSDFGDDLGWTPAHGPSGPPLKPKSHTNTGEPGSSQGAADASDTPMGE